MTIQDILSDPWLLIIFVAGGLQIKTWTKNVLRWATRKREKQPPEQRRPGYPPTSYTPTIQRTANPPRPPRKTNPKPGQEDR